MDPMSARTDHGPPAAAALDVLARLGVGVTEADDASLPSLVRPLLHLLEEVSGLEAVYLTTIDWEAGEQVVELAHNTATDAGFEVPEGAVVPWQETLCRRSLEEGSRWNVEVPTTWGDSPAAAALGIQSYVSVPVRVGDRDLPHGTLCGASPRRVEADPRLLDVLHLFARIIATAIQRDEALTRARARAEYAEHRLAERIRFTAQVEHALRSPITVITGWVHTLRRHDDAETLATGLDAIGTTAERLADQVSGLLTEARSSIGAAPAEDVDVRRLADELAPVAPDHDYAVEGALEVHADPVAVAVLLEHLVENAVTHTPAGTAVRVLLSDGVLVVEDDGPGLPDRDDLFEPFVSADPAVRGTGLGLHIVASLVERLGATLATGASPSGGARFEVTFPA